MGGRPGTYGKKKKGVSNLITVLVTTGMCLGCWYLGFSESVGLPLNPGHNATPLWRSLCLLLTEKAFILYTVGLFLLLFTSFLIQRGSFILLIIKGKTILPFLFVFLLNSTNLDIFPVQAASVALLFLLAAFYELFRSYQGPINVGRIYNAIMYISVGSLLWTYLLWFIPLFWYGLYKFRLLSIRSFFASVLGFFTTYWFVLAWCVWRHDYSPLTVSIQNLTNISLFSLKDSAPFESLVPFSIIVFIVISVYVILRDLNALRTRQFFMFLLVFSVYSFLLIFLYEHENANMLSVFYIPASILLAYLFSSRYGFISYLFYYSFLVFLFILFILRLWNTL